MCAPESQQAQSTSNLPFGVKTSDVRDSPFKVSTRSPTSSELDFFKRTNVPGYAASDNKVVLNPNPPQGVNMQAVALNEAARIFMRQNKMFNPDFKLTAEQTKFLDSTSYKNANSFERRATIAARILSGDPSAEKPTSAQIDFVDRLRGAM